MPRVVPLVVLPLMLEFASLESFCLFLESLKVEHRVGDLVGVSRCDAVVLTVVCWAKVGQRLWGRVRARTVALGPI